jgi:hypothetical protein
VSTCVATDDGRSRLITARFMPALQSLASLTRIPNAASASNPVITTIINMITDPIAYRCP